MALRLAAALVGATLAAATLPFVVGATPADAAPVTCHGERATIVGDGGRDVLEGTPGRDVIAGLGGNDTIVGLGGADTLCGGPGSDLLDGGRGDDALLGGLDLVEGGQTPYHRGDQLRGGPGDDLLDGGHDSRGPSGGGDIVLWDLAAQGVRVDLAAGTARGEGRDRVLLRDGKVYLSDHDDELRGTSGAEEVHALGGDDVVSTGRGADRVHADGVEDIGDDAVSAGPGDDVVTGRGTDEVRGGDGRDVLVLAGKGVKTASGGPGRDVVEAVVLSVAGHRLVGGEGRDRVLVELANSTGAGSLLDLGTGELSLEGTASVAEGFEDAEVYFGPFTVVGTDEANTVRTQDDASEVTFVGLGGDDAFEGGLLDDDFDGGEGTDSYLGDAGGLNTCTSVELDPTLACQAP